MGYACHENDWLQNQEVDRLFDEIEDHLKIKEQIETESNLNI